MKPNEAACALSHFEVWKLVAQCDRGTVACILEDDVRMMTSESLGISSGVTKAWCSEKQNV